MDELEKSLQYSFGDPKLLKRALTHASARSNGEDNERLEFLGDRVLGLVISEALHQKFTQATEGELAKRFNQLVRKQTCAMVAEALDLGQWIIVGASEFDGDVCSKPSILADACEAVIGALFLDGGYGEVARVIRRLWELHINSEPNRLIDPKSALQEWAQGAGLALPQYSEAERFGPDHKPLFTVKVDIEGYMPAEGKGRNKRSAEQAAARKFLSMNKIWTEGNTNQVYSKNEQE